MKGIFYQVDQYWLDYGKQTVAKLSSKEHYSLFLAWVESHPKHLELYIADQDRAIYEFYSNQNQRCE